MQNEVSVTPTHPLLTVEQKFVGKCFQCVHFLQITAYYSWVGVADLCFSRAEVSEKH
jgi:hypothetical protein